MHCTICTEYSMRLFILWTFSFIHSFFFAGVVSIMENPTEWMGFFLDMGVRFTITPYTLYRVYISHI